jgi:DNA-binding FadR family transcriptional regulator
MRLHREILRTLATEIIDGERGAGELLPKEVDLAEQFEVSRGVTRETIRALEERGLLHVRHGRGATVAPRERWDLFDPEVITLLLQSPSASEVLREYLECRRIVEIEVAGLAAERAAEPDLTLLRERFEAMEEAVRARGPHAEGKFHEADLAFHEALVSATGNRALGSLARRVHDALLAARYPLARPAYRKERALPEHRAVLDAVSARRPAAARKAMSAHLDTVAGYLEAHARKVRRG